MTIKLLKPACNRAAGTVIEVNDDHGALLIDKEYAIAASTVEIHAKAMASADTKQTLADVARKVKVKLEA